jgi:predicted DNA-binding transcriptional regulator AlpA
VYDLQARREVVEVPDESRIPFEELALNAEEVGRLLGCSGRQVLERIACKPDFPRRLSVRPASWVAKEVLEWRDKNRAHRHHNGKP